ncbi:MAG: c-type cytochrome [Hyphomicrobium sp.]|uniref:c-type cytochrome n=1 Tax=Hyphomicrobium sp. TaxID=82 RepID=UPI0039E57E0D
MVTTRFSLLLCAGSLALLAGAASRTSLAEDTPKSAAPTAKEEAWTVPDIDKLPDDVWGRTVRYGRDLISKTSTLIGPEVADASKRFAGNNLDCQSCHINAGTVEFALPLIGVYGDFPAYISRTGSVGTIEDRIQGCMERSMNGQPLPAEGAEMLALVSYLKFLSTGRPVGGATYGDGSGRMPELNRAADPVKGRTIFANTCAACHGNQGEGQRVGKIGDAKGYVFPPLWGPDSFNNGAGMDRLIYTANFLHSDMPAGTTWNNPTLSTEDAWDVAAYIVSQPRPVKPNLDEDYPNKLEKPVDTPYGPYADDFPAEQHKYGPFAPIEAAIKKLKAAEVAR